MTQREPLVIRACAAQKFTNFFHLTFGLGNRFQRRICVKLTGLNALQQTALKRPTTFRTIVINPAKLAIETATRLRESLLAAFFLQRQPKFSQPFGVIALAQFHVGKQDTIAAQAALRAKLRNGVGWKIFIHCGLSIITPLPAGGHPLPARRGEGRGEGFVHFAYLIPNFIATDVSDISAAART